MRVRAFCVCVAAVFAMGVVVASAAEASQFTSTVYPVSVKAGQTTKHAFKTDAGTVKCEKAAFTGELAAASETLPITPSYSECFIAGTDPAPVNFGTCSYRLRAGAEISTGIYKGTTDVVCPSGNVTVSPKEIACTITMGAQTGLGELTFTDGNPFLIGINVTGIHYTLAGTGCGVPAGNYTDGTYAGTAEVAAGTISVG